jgi:hypothetical protein
MDDTEMVPDHVDTVTTVEDSLQNANLRTEDVKELIIFKVRRGIRYTTQSIRLSCHLTLLRIPGLLILGSASDLAVMVMGRSLSRGAGTSLAPLRSSRPSRRYACTVSAP